MKKSTTKKNNHSTAFWFPFQPLANVPKKLVSSVIPACRAKGVCGTLPSFRVLHSLAWHSLKSDKVLNKEGVYCARRFFPSQTSLDGGENDGTEGFLLKAAFERVWGML